MSSQKLVEWAREMNGYLKLMASIIQPFQNAQIQNTNIPIWRKEIIRVRYLALCKEMLQRGYGTPETRINFPALDCGRSESLQEFIRLNTNSADIGDSVWLFGTEQNDVSMVPDDIQSDDLDFSDIEDLFTYLNEGNEKPSLVEKPASTSEHTGANIVMNDSVVTMSSNDLSTMIDGSVTGNKTGQQAAPVQIVQIQNALPLQTQAQPLNQSLPSNSIAPQIVNLPEDTNQNEPDASAPSFEAEMNDTQLVEGVATPILCVSASDPVPMLELILKESRDFHKKVLEELKKGEKQPLDNIPLMSIVLGKKVLPFKKLKSPDCLKKINTKLQDDKDFNNSVESALKRFYAPELYTKTISDILSSTFETEFSKTVRSEGKNAEGKEKKIAFKGTTLHKLIVDAVNICHPKLDEEKIENYIAQWLRQTNDRGRKRQSTGETSVNNKKNKPCSDSDANITQAFYV